MKDNLRKQYEEYLTQFSMLEVDLIQPVSFYDFCKGKTSEVKPGISKLLKIFGLQIND